MYVSTFSIFFVSTFSIFFLFGCQFSVSFYRFIFLKKKLKAILASIVATRNYFPTWQGAAILKSFSLDYVLNSAHDGALKKRRKCVYFP